MRNTNEEFIVKFTSNLTNALRLNLEQQKIVMDTLYFSLQDFEINTVESYKSNDLEEKILLYLQTKRIEGIKEGTIQNNYYFLREFSQFINKTVDKITTNDLRMFILKQSEKLKPSTVNNKISLLKTFFGWLQEEEYINGNPSKKLKGTKLPVRLRKSLTVMELEKLRLACINPRERALIEFLFATGCRISEVSNANIEDLDFSKNTLKVIGKGDKERVVCFTDKTKLHIQNYLNTRVDNNAALFVSIKKPYDRMGTKGLQYMIQKIAKRAGFDKSIFPHLLRHSMATLGLQSGLDITTIQHLLGHTNITTTQKYAETSFEDVQYQYKQHLMH